MSAALLDAARDLRPVLLDGDLSLKDAAATARGAARPTLGPNARRRIEAAHARLLGAVADDRLIYGVTTGFGPLANRLVSAGDMETLQRNLIHHLATGLDAPLSWAQARAVTLARLCSIARGFSGASVELAELLTALLASPFAPLVPSKGTVGASGDLTPLAHLALGLMGRAPFLDRAGRTVPAEAAFAAMGRAPLTLAARDGLALVNGTSAMTGVAVLNAERAERLMGWATALTAALAHALRGRTEAWRPEFSEARPHPGQARAAARLGALVAGSTRAEPRPAAARRLAADAPGRTESRPAQDAYSLRCAPQILGACLDALAWHDAVVARELNAATDNPIFPDGAEVPALHGGNFMGQHVGFASDALSNAVIVVAGLMERQIARLTDEGLNGGLPAFLHRGPAGLNSGFMGAQVTATALHAEMRARAVPASIQSISTNGANQDVVPMGTIAARKAAEHLEDAGRIAAILALALAQAADLVGGPAPRLRGMHDAVRALSGPLVEDRPLAGDIAAVADWLGATDPEELGA